MTYNVITKIIFIKWEPVYQAFLLGPQSLLDLCNPETVKTNKKCVTVFQRLYEMNGGCCPSFLLGFLGDQMYQGVLNDPGK